MSEVPIRLFLVRHGNTFEAGETSVQVGAKTDLVLTDRGREQAYEMAQCCISEGIKLSRVLSGSLMRQTEAAKVIAEATGSKAELITGVTELDELDYGAWEGLTVEELQSRFPVEYSNWSEAGVWPEEIFPESFHKRIDGLEQFLSRLRVESQAGDVVLAVSSNGIIRLFQYFLKGRWEELSTTRQMEELKVKTGNFCEIHVFPESIKVVRWNASP